MTVRYDENRKRIICRWVEPIKVTMNKKEGVINRTRMITVKVNDNGQLSSKDRRRHEKHPMFPYIRRFNRLLSKTNSFTCPDGNCVCAACGESLATSPHYDALTGGVVWLCGEHSHMATSTKPAS